MIKEDINITLSVIITVRGTRIMPAEKKSTLEEDIPRMLGSYPKGLGFTELYDKLQAQKSEGYYHWAASNTTISQTLKALRHKKIVEKDIDTGKYLLTDSGRKQAVILGLSEQIKSCKISMEEAEQPQDTSTYLLMDFVKNDVTQKEIAKPDPSKDNFGRATVDFMTFSPSIRNHNLKLTSEIIKELARKEELSDLNEEKLKEKVLEAISKRIKRIVLVEVLDPSLLLEELKREKEQKKALTK